MKSQARLQLDGLVDGFVQVTVIDEGVNHQVRVTPRKMLGVVSQLMKIDDRNVRTVSIPVNGTFMQFKINQAESQQLASGIDELMKWKR